MKQIQPITVWPNTANYLRLTIVNDNLVDSATFLFELLNVTQTEPETEEEQPAQSISVLSNGNASLTGQDYEDWGNETPINEDAYIRIAAKLNLTLINS